MVQLSLMRVLISMFFIVLFLVELTLDSSTIFVRSSSIQYSVCEESASNSSSDSTTGPKKNMSPTRFVETAAHAALPLLEVSSQFWSHTDSIFLMADIVMPVLNPPIMRIDRPPIFSISIITLA